MIKIKRAYEPADAADGYRILIDRLWPRGVSKERADIDLWFKDVSPSNELRKWFGHDPDKWDEFQKRYSQELSEKQELIKQFETLVNEHKVVTLVYSAKDELHNDAVFLQKYLESR